MKNKRMNIFFSVYLLVCFVVIGAKYWYKKRVKNKKNHKELDFDINDDANSQMGKNDKEDLKYSYDIVNSWVNNCDQKSGIILTVIGVVITILMTSDFLKDLRAYIFIPFVKYWTEESELIFSVTRFTVFCLLAVAILMLILSCFYLFKAISANVDYKKIYNENPRLVKKSYIYYGTISEMTYEKFKKEEVDYVDDLKSQIYINSKIAIAKFKNYNQGLYWLKFLLLVSIMLFISIMLMN